MDKEKESFSANNKKFSRKLALLMPYYYVIFEFTKKLFTPTFAFCLKWARLCLVQVVNSEAQKSLHCVLYPVR